ncbi:hypothetical protein PUNSTDRAFT_135425 [Punctularia strigosozonata HHB-11173 SS5]|uniref:uncharacterized protein n=1 Tax=Punctularia strigosozonata (strain HHB-11173) TaxID=741275 RepID=UPI0004416547|nr:uncharacterized protein PUNSTDRAFT_135425 [Punctularia strigosozonata HHB-11173 SS5]EIN07903.1 hypothetical protein PUNSTDRAFT_135425 [Punctularia strigosozonata HHB-11173 SS5]
MKIKDLVTSCKTQLDDFWHGRAPFNKPLHAGQTSLSWWTEFEHRNDTRILAVLAVKLFSILANSMPDERTGSKITWLNSSIRGKQKVQTLIDMIQVNQWYGDHLAEVKRPERKRPVVKFRDLSADMLNIAKGHQQARADQAASSDDDVTDDEDDGGAALRTSGGSVRTLQRDTDDPAGASPAGIVTDEDVDLRSGALRDMLSSKPVPGAPALAGRFGRGVSISEDVEDAGETDSEEYNWDEPW